MLDLSKIEAGKMKVVLEPTDIHAVACEVAAIVAPLARNNGNAFEFRQGDFEGIIHTDGGMLRQLHLNLLSNACKFTTSGRVSLRISREALDGREWINWHVADSGIGISTGDRPKLFQAFSQLDSSATRRHGGTGLGLAISRKLCQMLGGRLTVESSPGRGSTFTLHLPADRVGGDSQPEALVLLHRALSESGAATQDVPPEVAHLRPGLEKVLNDA